uniref:Photosystem I assembly protein Ycf4 n=1 Tax=Corynoplastis japonica TaxID=700918 RepID=A0A1X9PTV1_9RHOD|nr:photosystem I assembly protein ycf4 [Corynoplastis japonica]
MNLQLVRKEKIIGARRFSSYFWATTICIGGIGFLLTGLSSYLNISLLPFIKTYNLSFIPQGIIMTFYGSAAICLSIFLWSTIILNIGSGYNEFNKQEKNITIYRKGFPGKNRNILLTYAINEIKSIRVGIKEGLNPKREIYLELKDSRLIPLTRVGQPMALTEIENQAIAIAQFLGVVVEGLDFN